ncbi:hypothetical protein [Paraburkholderia lycopersici]|uniref:hypothetical protein n=1 Tax=Paraburkholderia lycopersici TaxID=416944 RepID=UPI000B83E61B|nr:hypothetical protein [Paraburkholderia lycopersici]
MAQGLLDVVELDTGKPARWRYRGIVEHVAARLAKPLHEPLTRADSISGGVGAQAGLDAGTGSFISMCWRVRFRLS